MTAAQNARPSNWQKANGVDLISYDDDTVWSLDVRLKSGERIGVELSKLSVLTLAASLAAWKEWVKTSPTGRRSFSKRGAK
jgi:hypothetical protein